MTRLRPQQALFVQEYLKDLNATQAAIRAGYSRKTAQEQGSRLLSNVMVAKAIEEANANRLERVSYNADTLLADLLEQHKADLADLFAPDGSMKPIHDWPKVWRQGLVSGIEVEEIFEGEGEGEDKTKAGQVHKLRLSDRVKRLELIGKHIGVGAFKEKVEHNLSDPLMDLMKEITGQSIRPKQDGGADE